MAKETTYEVVKGKVLKSFSNNEGTSFKLELLSEKPTDFIKCAYSEVKSDRFLPEILTNEKCNNISFHSKFEIPTVSSDNEKLDASSIGENSVIRVKLKTNGNGLYPVAIIVEELVEKEPYNPFDF